MKLTELEPQFHRYKTGIADSGHGQLRPDGTTQWGGFECESLSHVDTLAEAQGIMFLCPLCFKANNGPVGTHSVLVSFADRGVLPHQGSHSSDGNPSRWTVSGTGYEDLTTTPSIHLTGPGCGWHGFITNGKAS